MGGKIKNVKSSPIQQNRQVPQRGAMFAGIRNKLMRKPAAPPVGVKPVLPPANPALAAAAQLNQSPMSPPPGKELGQALPPVSPVAPAPVVNPMEDKQKQAALAAQPPVDAGAAQVAPAPVPQIVSPAANMEAQKAQMFPPAPAAVAPPVAPKPAPSMAPAGVAKSQAEIDEEKKKLQAAAGSPV